MWFSHFFTLILASILKLFLCIACISHNVCPSSTFALLYLLTLCMLALFSGIPLAQTAWEQGYKYVENSCVLMSVLFGAEYAENGSLFSFLHERNRTPSKDHCLQWANQIAEGNTTCLAFPICNFNTIITYCACLFLFWPSNFFLFLKHAFRIVTHTL